MPEGFIKALNKNWKSSSRTSNYLIISSVLVKFRNGVPPCHSIMLSCHPVPPFLVIQSEAKDLITFTSLHNASSWRIIKELHRNLFILNESELPAKVKVLFILIIYNSQTRRSFIKSWVRNKKTSSTFFVFCSTFQFSKTSNCLP